jgi:hypothetical protein
MDGKDLDWYRISGVKEKNLTVQLENLSQLRPIIRIRKSDKSIAQDSAAPNAGADLKFSIASEPGQDYFVEVGSHYGESAGLYRLTVR